MYDLTVIIFTLDEESNIGKIIPDVNRILHENAINGKILVVDDNSTDKTIEIVNDLKQTYKNLDILIRAFDHGLSYSVVDGFSNADSDIFIVMDADFSHPPAIIPDKFNGIVAGNDSSESRGFII